MLINEMSGSERESEGEREYYEINVTEKEFFYYIDLAQKQWKGSDCRWIGSIRGSKKPLVQEY